MKFGVMDASKLKKECNVQELSSEEVNFTPSDVERALWSSVVGAKLLSSQSYPDSKTNESKKSSGGKRKR